VNAVWVAITGTPGCGKTTVTARLRERGYHTVSVTDLARDAGLLDEKDPERGAFIVDEDALAARFRERPIPDSPAFVEGHFAHALPVDLVILLRVDPLVLLERLRARGWPEKKVRENVEAEALDVIAGDVLACGTPAVEVDVTTMSVDEVTNRVMAIVENQTQALKSDPVGHVAWPLERLPWF
jgi:adenylate kinase